jgi:hypothetical protein
MKKVRPFLTVALILIITSSVHAQFLNRLQKQVQRSVEDAVIQKTAEEAAEQTGKAMEKIFEASYKNIPNYEKAEPVQRADLPDVYDFDWLYRLELTARKEKMNLVYHLKENTDYLATAVPDQMDMLMVMDRGRNITITYMETDDSRMATAYSLPKFEIDEEEQEFNDSFSFRKTGKTKRILNYDCEEIIGENDDHKYIFFYTRDVDVGMTNVFQSDQKGFPEGFKKEWLEDGIGMMMEMQLIDKNKSKNNMTMRCTELSRKSFTVENDDYQFFAL